MVDARVANVVARHERSLMRVARHWSLCRDDALDAYQRALEIYVRRIDAVDPVTEISWLRVVVKHEALAVRRMRAESVTVEDVDLDGHAPEAQRPVDELLAARERVSRGAEALRRLKPDEAKALMLKAEGHSYKEISEQLGWTYTKTNRAITEGRARFLKVFAAIETGAECERVAPTLAALVGGTATADALLELRPHLQHCTTCRATVRSLHESRLGRLAALWPIPAVLAPLRWVQAASAHQPIRRRWCRNSSEPPRTRTGSCSRRSKASRTCPRQFAASTSRTHPSSSATNDSSTSRPTSSSGGSAFRAATSRPPLNRPPRTAAAAASRRSARSSASASAASAQGPPAS